MILQIVPKLARLYFLEKFPVTLSYVQAFVLLCMGLQGKDISVVEGEMKLEMQQILSLFIKVMKKFYKYLYSVASKEIDSTVPRLKEISMEPHNIISVDEDLDEAAKKVQDDMNAKMNGLLNPELLEQYGSGKVVPGGLISVQSNRVEAAKHG